MTNQEQYDDIWKELKILKEKLDRTEKQRNALIIALNYTNNTINAMDDCWKYNPKYAKRFYKDSIKRMKEVMKNALLMAVAKSEGTINLEVKEDDNN